MYGMLCTVHGLLWPAIARYAGLCCVTQPSSLRPSSIVPRIHLRDVLKPAVATLEAHTVRYYYIAAVALLRHLFNGAHR